MIDLHVHSTCSDGTVSAELVVAEAAKRGLTGISLTDHNGVWGQAAAKQTALSKGLSYIEGIEISAADGHDDIHILGYSRSFTIDILEAGLATTRSGYHDRVAQMVALCQKAGYSQVSLEKIEAARAHLTNPVYVSYDVTKQLQETAGVPAEVARQLTVRGGSCYVPYGEWALSLSEVIDLIHQASGIAVLAHPGIIAYESGARRLKEILQKVTEVGIDGIEVNHPFHSPILIQQLQDFAQLKKVLITGGSDWHGPDRFKDSDFGTFGITDAEFTTLLNQLPA